MKLISKNDTHPTFKIQYFGIEFVVPMMYLHGYIVTHKNGEVVASIKKPYSTKFCWEGTENSTVLGRVDLESTKWEDTMVSVQDFKISKGL